MSIPQSPVTTPTPSSAAPSRPAPSRQTWRASTETKAAFKTTELLAYVASIVAVVVTANVVDGHHGQPDQFRASQAMLFIVILTFGYMLSRGFAKSGSREPYDRSIDLRDRDSS